jgi:hypothetical protein
MAYTLADFSHVQASLLDTRGLWHMLKKDLLQNLEMPRHFNKTTCPDLGCAPNLAVMIVAMSGLETMATLANIGGVPAGGAGDDATERVKRFADRQAAWARQRSRSGSDRPASPARPVCRNHRPLLNQKSTLRKCQCRAMPMVCR